MKKLVITLLVALTIGASFYIGRITTEPKEIIKEVVVKDLEITTEEEKEETKEVVVDGEYFINVEDIIDWNTNGEEISLITKDGYEYYAYKSGSVYGDLRYYNIKEVDSWKVIDNNVLEIKFSDGNVYEWER